MTSSSVGTLPASRERIDLNQMRKKNTYANVLANIVYTLVIMAFTFVNRKVFLTQLNVTYFGLNSLCVDILSMLSLAELGIGQAMVYACLLYTSPSPRD